MDMTYRDERHRADPRRASEADRLLNSDKPELWKAVYQLLCRVEHAERRASERERLLEQNERLKSKLFDLMHVKPAGKLDCCQGMHGTSEVTGEEVRFHEPGCPQRALTVEEIGLLGDMLRSIDREEFGDIGQEHVDALRRCFGSNKQIARRIGAPA